MEHTLIIVAYIHEHFSRLLRLLSKRYAPQFNGIVHEEGSMIALYLRKTGETIGPKKIEKEREREKEIAILRQLDLTSLLMKIY